MKRIQNLRECTDISLVGGKAANLGALLRAGFEIPDGFVMTTAARDEDVPEIRDAYHKLTAPAVAVRSSATVEDSSEVSSAGQFNTVLNVQTEYELLHAIKRCRASNLTSAESYLRESGVEDSVRMAVVVQRQIPADVAGVLFTEAPLNPKEMLIEAAPGLGENVVSGRIQPDVIRVNYHSGEIIASICPHKTPVLSETDISKLWSLGRDVVAHFGHPQDVEWAIAGGKLFLLQARPVTTADRSATRARMIERTRKQLVEAGRGPWVLHNLAETLPHPTPLSWSVLRQFMSGSGGFGKMYRRLGFNPAATEFLELILGRIYLDLSRAPSLFGEAFPFTYDTEDLQHNRFAAEIPPSRPNGSWIARMRAYRQLAKAQRQIDIEAIDFDRKLTTKIIPEFIDWCAAEKKRDLSQLSAEGWIALWHERESRVFDQFAPEIFFTGFISADVLTCLRKIIAEHFWDECPDTLTQLLAFAGTSDKTAQADNALRKVAENQCTVEDWLAEFGHRAIGEFDLATPRWRETPEALLSYARRLRGTADSFELSRKRRERARQRITNLPSDLANEIWDKAELAQRYLIFREDGKHYLMLGYDLLRDMVLDASRRLGLDVNWLTFDELREAMHGKPVADGEVARRKRIHRAEGRFTLPNVIDEATVSTLGEMPALEDHERLHGDAISSGFASGPVRIVHSPLDATELGRGYVLVCPSTDPQWTPLFLNASALVLECGGSLSHGAIVARELNLPAVVLPDATRLLHEDEQIFVDGDSGAVLRKSQTVNVDPDDSFVAFEKRPPVPGQRERRAARLRNLSFMFWSVVLLCAWALPRQWVYQPAIHLLDKLLWPIVQHCGRPAAAAMIGAGLAAVAAITQYLIADNMRVREAARRARFVAKEAASLPSNSKRADALQLILRSVHWRVIGTAFVPVGLLLGVFIFSFLWLKERIDRPNPLPGSTARITAQINANFREPITLAVGPPLHLDSSPNTRSVAPIREALERLASQNRLSEPELADLGRFLDRGVPPQTFVWLVRSDVAGSFPVSFLLGNRPPVHQRVVFGDHLPPPDDQAIPDHPLQFVKVQAEDSKKIFSNHEAKIPILNRQMTWPWIYLGAYLSIWVVLRRSLKLV